MTLRLCLSSVQETRNMNALVERALERLIECEPSWHVPLSGEINDARPATAAHGSPHGRGHLCEIDGHNSTSIDTWGTTMDPLWCVTITGDCASKHELTYRTAGLADAESCIGIGRAGGCRGRGGC